MADHNDTANSFYHLSNSVNEIHKTVECKYVSIEGTLDDGKIAYALIRICRCPHERHKPRRYMDKSKFMMRKRIWLSEFGDGLELHKYSRCCYFRVTDPEGYKLTPECPCTRNGIANTRAQSNF